MIFDQELAQLKWDLERGRESGWNMLARALVLYARLKFANWRLRWLLYWG